MKKSWLHLYISSEIENANHKRPKIAIIDTGFNPPPSLFTNKLKLRLNMGTKTAKEKCNWKDEWKPGAMLQDDDGHGTAMLSIVHQVAPFADICIARIAGKDKDLKDHPEVTSKNLAEVFLQYLRVAQFMADTIGSGYKVGGQGARCRYYFPLSRMGKRVLRRQLR